MKLPFSTNEIYKASASSPTCIDLFSGAGGLSLGFLMAGGMPLGAIDTDEKSINSYKSNFRTAKDVSCQKIETWKPSLTKGSVDVIIGGPPCQGFSLARGLRFVDDPRNHLYKYFVRIVKHFQPVWTVMENVEGITNIGGGKILQQIFEDFHSIGYSMDVKVINMAMYGVPQTRKRAIFVGNRTGKKFQWPTPTFVDQRKVNSETELLEDYAFQPFVSINAALGDLLLPQGNYLAHRANAQMRGPRNRDVKTEPSFTLRVRGDELALCEHPASSAFIPGPAPTGDIEYLKPQNHLQELLRQKGPKWSTPLTSPKRPTYKRPEKLKGTRRLTVREQARLQSFPDWFFFDGSPTDQARQIGNAVPPLFGFQLFSSIFVQL